METDRQAGEQPQTSTPAQQPPKGNGAAEPPEKIERIDLATLKDMSVGALTKIAKQLDVPGATGMRKQELIFEILKARGLALGWSMVLPDEPAVITAVLSSTLARDDIVFCFGGIGLRCECRNRELAEALGTAIIRERR